MKDYCAPSTLLKALTVAIVLLVPVGSLAQSETPATKPRRSFDLGVRLAFPTQTELLGRRSGQASISVASISAVGVVLGAEQPLGTRLALSASAGFERFGFPSDEYGPDPYHPFSDYGSVGGDASLVLSLLGGVKLTPSKSRGDDPFATLKAGWAWVRVGEHWAEGYTFSPPSVTPTFSRTDVAGTSANGPAIALGMGVNIRRRDAHSGLRVEVGWTVIEAQGKQLSYVPLTLDYAF